MKARQKSVDARMLDGDVVRLSRSHGKRLYRGVTLLLCAVVLGSCSVKGGNVIDLMPPPDVFVSSDVSPFDERFDPSAPAPYQGILYATNRQPHENQAAGEGSATTRDRRYENERGHVVRLGAARVSIGEGDIDWEEARRISLLKNRPGNYPLRVTSVTEFGILDSTIHPFLDPEAAAGLRDTAERLFTDAVNAKLDMSSMQDIVIYVHGYKVVFENPILVMAELWHFLGYEGVAIAYSWPSTPKRTAYFADIQTAELSALSFRLFLSYLAQQTRTRRIHIVAYSAGTRLVARALQDLALMARGDPDVAGSSRLGAVVLAASDIDRQQFGAYLADGILDVVDELMVYTSASDKALAISRWSLAKRDRLGQAFASLDPASPIAAYLRDSPKLTVVNVSGAEGADAGNGHGYFRSSPLASSDILTRLRWGLSPAERGLSRDIGSGIWTFPENYIENLQPIVARLHREGR